METITDEHAAFTAQASVAAVVSDTVSDIFDVVIGFERSAAMIDGLRAEAINAAIRWSSFNESTPVSTASRDLRLRSLRAELACALKIPERTAESMLVTSEHLVNDLPTTLIALKAGNISYRHARLMVDQTMGLDDGARAELEQAALPYAHKLTVAKFERKLRTLRELANPETIVERQVKARSEREVRFAPDRDGMAWLNAYLPAGQALGIFNRLTTIAKALKRGGQGAEHASDCAARVESAAGIEGADGIERTGACTEQVRSEADDRTLTQLRADVFCDLLLDGEPTDGPRGIRPRVFVTVPVLTLLGEQIPASLDGYGPIDAETARRLSAHAPSFTRLLTHPEDGAVLSVGQTSYAVPQDLKNWLQVRDVTCRFPGCSRHASHCEIDHTYDWAYGGGTRHDNLAHLCKSHHTLKHNTEWKVAQAGSGAGGGSGGGGVLTWTSPSGRSYVTEPEVRIRT